jgi:hypothetical protein
MVDRNKHLLREQPAGQGALAFLQEVLVEPPAPQWSGEALRGAKAVTILVRSTKAEASDIAILTSDVTDALQARSASDDDELEQGAILIRELTPDRRRFEVVDPNGVVYHVDKIAVTGDRWTAHVWRFGDPDVISSSACIQRDGKQFIADAPAPRLGEFEPLLPLLRACYEPPDWSLPANPP